MKNIKPYYLEEIMKIAKKIDEEKCDFLIAVAADSHLDNSIDDFTTNISEVDKLVNFDCLVHLGDFLNGNIPPKYTKKILESQMDMYRGAINKKFYPVQGNHDGYMDNIFYNANDMAIDENWYEATRFVSEYDNVSRIEPKPYYYADYPEKKIRIIVLCSFSYKIDENKFYKIYGTSDEQIKWLKNEALKLDSSWTVLIFSHDTPFGEFSDSGSKNDKTRVNGQLLMDTVLLEKNKRQFDLAGWFVGHFHGDYIGKIRGINFILVGSQTAYVPQLWEMPKGGGYAERDLGTVTEDLWDSVLIDKKRHLLKLIRFGAGEDRSIEY